MIKPLALTLPNSLTVARLLAGPIYLVWGSVPAGTETLLMLVAVAATDLIDGWVARAVGATTSLGAALDTTADKVFILCIMLKLTIAGGLNVWLFVLVLMQYCARAVAGSAYTMRYKKVPIPETTAHLAAWVAVGAALTGIAFMNQVLTTTLVSALVLSNFAHLFIAWQRVLGVRE